ncbi:hypothetical protein [Dyella caseinilytica]|uniref:DUF4142 domain-containing protein n=1 Tax=Dyella caseinilytica TaxID=1849581 RepID=A0ABX7GTP0_9GAMM|nr:hypothetical protein [Dyella caseinilytica]QRN53816.1 hypothetical protein ISN74_20885 [Dyella caseinilytica]GFZ89389.1 hypothetical protein GCM10011408_05390 [Dyella caseinilytica]
MFRFSHHQTTLLALAFVCATSTFAAGLHAQSTIQHALTPDDRTAVQHYTLTEDSYQKLLAIAKDAKANKIQINAIDPNAHSLDDTVADLDKSADVRALLARHSVSPREFLLGEYALLEAEFAVKYANQPGFDSDLANPVNIALFRKHEAEIDALSGDDSNN